MESSLLPSRIDLFMRPLFLLVPSKTVNASNIEASEKEPDDAVCGLSEKRNEKVQGFFWLLFLCCLARARTTTSHPRLESWRNNDECLNATRVTTRRTERLDYATKSRFGGSIMLLDSLFYEWEKYTWILLGTRMRCGGGHFYRSLYSSTQVHDISGLGLVKSEEF